MQILSLEILSGLCLMPDGHKKILQAISDASEALGERTRFQRITEDLWRPYRNEREAVRVKTTIMSLINALLKSGPAEVGSVRGRGAAACSFRFRSPAIAGLYEWRQ